MYDLSEKEPKRCEKAAKSAQAPPMGTRFRGFSMFCNRAKQVSQTCFASKCARNEDTRLDMTTTKTVANLLNDSSPDHQPVAAIGLGEVDEALGAGG